MVKITPMVQQYLDIKQNHEDAILFYRMGDFYEMFFEDAIKAAKILEIVLTTRNKNAEEKVPMCGVPYHSATGYINKLISHGLKVAICEQKEEEEVTGLVKREVVRVITPGLIADADMLEEKVNNFLIALYPQKTRTGLASLDISTGEFGLMEADEKGLILDEIIRLNPLEILVAENMEREGEYRFLGDLRNGRIITCRKDAHFDILAARECLLKHFKTVSLDGFGCEEMIAGIRAAGTILRYVQETQKASLAHIRKLSPYFIRDYVIIDDTTRRNLELTRKAVESRANERGGSLLHILDLTMTSMGGRLLRKWIDYPLRRIDIINERLQAVSALKDEPSLRRQVREVLGNLYDLERLNSRMVLGHATPRDALALRNSLMVLPDLNTLIPRGNSRLLDRISNDFDPLSDIATLIEQSIREDAPIGLREGGIIKEGFSTELDGLTSIQRNGKSWIANLESTERLRTGISSLRIGFNRVFGYYIEVTKANMHLVPGDYLRKQTLVNAERFITPELKDYEEKVLTAEDKKYDLEYRLFQETRCKIASETVRILQTASLLAQLDVLCAFSEIADLYGYICPQMDESDRIVIREGRHPVIERNLKRERFVPNSIALDNDQNQMLIITGPNMAGKSTILRQVALIVLMAHMGSFVPAEQASIGIVDRIFSRVGAMDDLSRGQSTFLVEMTETANILNNATDKSLVIMDEIGRGTSTFDGLSIAWAVAEYLLEKGGKGVRTLFATHYHELAELAHTQSKVKNYNVTVKEWNGEIIFLHRIAPGSVNHSYGIQVAQLAGLPPAVVKRAKEVLKRIEKSELGNTMKKPAKSAVQLPLFDSAENRALGMIKNIDLACLTPLDALNLLSELQRYVR